MSDAGPGTPTGLRPPSPQPAAEASQLSRKSPSPDQVAASVTVTAKAPQTSDAMAKPASQDTSPLKTTQISPAIAPVSPPLVSAAAVRAKELADSLNTDGGEEEDDLEALVAGKCSCFEVCFADSSCRHRPGRHGRR